MASANQGLLAGRFELLQPKLADRFEHPKTRLAAELFVQLDEALRDQRIQAAQDVEVGVVGRADGLGRFERPATYEHGESTKQAAFRVAEEVVAPGDGVP